jgi:hypothetical protein
MAVVSGHSFNIGPFKISANENTIWTLAAMLDFKSAPKAQIW